jgi:hypothetical protein
MMIAGKGITGIVNKEQTFFDEPVYVTIRPERSSLLAAAVSACFPSKFVGCYERVQLRWLKPDGKGGLVPK